MKTQSTFIQLCWRGLWAAVFGALSFNAVQAQIFVANTSSPFSVEEYHTDGTLMNATFIPDAYQAYSLEIGGGYLYVANKTQPLSKYQLDGTLVSNDLIGGGFAFDLAVSASDLFVTGYGSTVAKYTTSGTVINTSFITGLSQASGIMVSGGNLYVSNSSIGTIGEYDATTGAAINTSFITGLSSAFGIKISGNDLFVLNQTGSVGEYDATTGAVINASLITGLDNPANMALAGSDLYITSFTGNGIYKFTTGGVYEGTVVSGLGHPYGIAVSPEAVPEPSTWALLAGGVVALFYGARRRTA